MNKRLSSYLIYEDFGGEDVLAEVVKVNPLSKLAVTSPCLLRSSVQVLHLGIVVEPADKVKAQIWNLESSEIEVVAPGDSVRIGPNNISFNSFILLQVARKEEKFGAHEVNFPHNESNG